VIARSDKKLGPDLKPSTADCSNAQTGRIVQEKTGLKGLYDWELRFDPEVLIRMASQAGVNVPAGRDASAL